MASNEPLEPQRRSDDGVTRDLGDLRVSTGSQSAYLTIEMILYVLAVLGVFVTSAIIDSGQDLDLAANNGNGVAIQPRGVLQGLPHRLLRLRQHGARTGQAEA